MENPQSDTPDLTALLARLHRLESVEEIRQLAMKYAVCLDQRDYDSLVNLFVDDIGVPGKLRGRHALKQWYLTTARNGRTRSTAHITGNHIVEFESDTMATGLVYSRNELETETRWMVEMMIYLDRYTHEHGRWLFKRRTPLFLYQCPMNEIPLDDFKVQWGDHPPVAENFHSAFPSWDEFWQENDALFERAVPPPSPLGQFLIQLRRNQELPRVKPAGAMRREQ